MHAPEIVTLCAIIAAGFLCNWLAWRIRVPAILFLLLAGIVAGPVMQWLQPAALFGDLLVSFVSIAVAVILFEGSLTLKFSELKGHGAAVRNLVTVGVLVTWFFATAAVYLLLDWDLYLAALFGAIVTVSGPTVVLPLLRTVRPVKSVASVLRWEAILIDPLGAILGLLVFDFIVASRTAPGSAEALTTFGIIALAGGALGVIGGYLFGLALRRHAIPDYLREFGALAVVLTVFAAAEAVMAEAGLLAVTVMGIWLANMKDVEIDDVLTFKESLTLVLVSGLFIVLAAQLQVESLLAISTGALLVFAFLQLFVGPLRAAVSSLGSSLTGKERLFIGWVFPRGIVAAAISSLFALRLQQLEYPGAQQLVPLVFIVIIGTVVIQSLTARPLAKWLGVAEPDPKGVLVVGSNPVALAIALEMDRCGHGVLVADSHWASIRKARMLGLSTFYGSALSGYASSNLDLAGLGRLLAVSRRPGVNELACVRYAREFGRKNVYTLSNQQDQAHDKHKVSGTSRGRVLFGGTFTLTDFLDRLDEGDELKTTELTEEFGFREFRDRYPGCWPVFGVDSDGDLHFVVDEEAFEPKPKWRVTALVQGHLA